MSRIFARGKVLPEYVLMSSASTSRNKTAGIIVIGDEILKGEVLDTNSNYMTKTLHILGVKVNKISVIGDQIDEISEEARLFSNKFDYVLTTGGIGPTHDDVTFEGLGKAFNEPLVPHPTLIKVCSRFYKTTDLRAPGMKLAFIPESAKLTFSEDKSANYPVISVRNIYVFPGIPELLKKSINLLGSKLFSSDAKFYTSNVYINVSEQYIAETLVMLLKQFPNITCGSYPEMFNSTYKVKITIESTDELSTAEATKKLLEMVPKEFLVK